MNRRDFLASLSATLARAGAAIPANNNVKWAVSLGLWGHFRPVPFTGILDLMRDTGFIGIRLTDFPRCLETYGMTPSQLEKEVSKRKLHVRGCAGPSTFQNGTRPGPSPAAHCSMTELQIYG